MDLCDLWPTLSLSDQSFCPISLLGHPPREGLVHQSRWPPAPQLGIPQTHLPLECHIDCGLSPVSKDSTLTFCLFCIF